MPESLDTLSRNIWFRQSCPCYKLVKWKDIIWQKLWRNLKRRERGNHNLLTFKGKIQTHFTLRIKKETLISVKISYI